MISLQDLLCPVYAGKKFAKSITFGHIFIQGVIIYSFAFFEAQIYGRTEGMCPIKYNGTTASINDKSPMLPEIQHQAKIKIITPF
jgi:hypothetical protein